MVRFVVQSVGYRSVVRLFVVRGHPPVVLRECLPEHVLVRDALAQDLLVQGDLVLSPGLVLVPAADLVAFVPAALDLAEAFAFEPVEEAEESPTLVPPAG